MYHPTTVQLWTTWLFVYVGTPLAWLSVLLHLKTPWSKSQMGKHLLSYALVIAAVMSFATVGYWWGRPFDPWVDWLRLGVYGSLIFVMAWRVALQVQSVGRPGGKKP